MFMFKAVQARERGGVLVFTKRKTSHSRFVAEFALFSLNCADNVLIHRNVGKNLTVAPLNSSPNRKIAPFHIESNQYDGSVRVLFEIEEHLRYMLCWRISDATHPQVIFCNFVIGKKEHENYSDGDIRDLIKKSFIFIEKIPELFLFSDNLEKYYFMSLAVLLFKLIENFKGNPNKCAKLLREFDIEKSLQTLPSLDELILRLTNLLEKDRITFINQAGELSTNYLKNLAKSSRFNYFNHEIGECSGFLAMCRIAFNGNSSARELCKVFLLSAIGRNDDYIISSIGQTSYTTTNDLKVIVHDYLSELSVIEQSNREMMNAGEREVLFNNISSLISSQNSLLYYWNPLLFSNETPNNFHTLTLISVTKLESDRSKLGWNIPDEIYFNAVISARNGNANCIQFFNLISDKMEEFSLNALKWTYRTQLNLKQHFQIHNYLSSSRKDIYSSTCVARKLIVGIPEIVEKNPSLGYSMLRKLYRDNKGAAAAAAFSLGHLFMGNVSDEFPPDLERSLFWLEKSLPVLGTNSELIIYLKGKGISIQHPEKYFTTD